jgi:hypothetical protein
MRPAAFVLLLACATPAVAQPADGRFDLAVTGGQLTLDRLGIRPEERGTALVLLARALHGVSAMGASGSMAINVTEMFGPITLPPTPPAIEGPAATVLAPFNERTWQAVLTPAPGVDLFSALIKHRGALLVAAGALQTTPEVRGWLERDPRLLQQIVVQWPGAFTQAAPGLDLRDRGIVVPGGAARDAVWTGLVGAPPSRPEEFLRRLLARDEGRLARFYGVLARLDGARLAALLQPLPGENATDALSALYEVARDAEAPWDANLHPFQLSYADLVSVLHSLNDLPIDRLPASAGWWPALVQQHIQSRADAAELVRTAPITAPYAASVRAMLSGAPRRRRDQVAMIALARRTWRDGLAPAAQADLVYALGHFSQYRALLLMLDRIDVKSPAVWARSIDAARRVDNGSNRDRELKLGAFQGALALVERASMVSSLDAAATEKALLTLATAVDTDAPVPASVRSWLLDTFIPSLPPLVRPDRFSQRSAYESRVLQALAGAPTASAQPFSWEGLDYTVDPMAGEHERIIRIREQLPTPGLDLALESRDPDALVTALRAMVYAPALGDPDGPVTLSPDVITRHDFGGTRSPSGRNLAWLPAVERTGTGGPWHVAGSLLGLDLALGRSALRRLSADEMPAVPTINLNDQLTLARSAVALATSRFDDATRDELAAAIVRGRRRLADAGVSVPALLALGDEVGMTSAARQALPWTLASMPEAGPLLFSLRDLMWLGRPRLEPEVMANWGVISEPVDGRLGTRFDAPVPWDHLAGRPDTGVLATQVPDLTLRLAEITAEKHVPAALIPALLLFATQDYWHEVEARFADDWPAMARGALALPAVRVEDYTAALGSGGPLRPH